MNLEILNFINKYKSKYQLEIVLITKYLHKTNQYEIFDINVKNNENKLKTILNKYNKCINSSIEKYYYEDKYMEINNNNIEVKKKIIIDSLYNSNLLIKAYEIKQLDINLIPGLNEYNKESIEYLTIYNINNNNIILKSNSDKTKLCCYININNVEDLDNSISLIKQIV